MDNKELYHHYSQIDGINIYKLDWEILEFLSIIDAYDYTILVKYEGELNDYTAIADYSCGQIVNIYEIEINAKDKEKLKNGKLKTVIIMNGFINFMKWIS